MSKFTAYISQSNGGAILKTLAIPYDLEQDVKNNISKFVSDNANIVELNDAEYVCIACRDSMLDPKSVTTMDGLANNKAYVTSVNFKIDNRVVKIL